MPKLINMDFSGLDGLEDYLTRSYAPVRLSSSERHRHFGRTGRVFAQANMMLEWCSTTGTYEIEPMEPMDGVIFTASKVHGARYGFQKDSFVVKPGFALAFRQPKTIEVHDGSIHTLVVFKNPALQSRLASLLDSEAPPVIEFAEKPVDVKALDGFVAMIEELNSDSVLAMARKAERSDSFSHFLMDAFLLSYPNNCTERLTGDAPSIAPRQVRRAINYMHDHLGDRLTIVDIAAAAGVSVRALPIAFQKFKGDTPMGYLRTLRLQAVHKRLADPGNHRSVSQVAYALALHIWDGFLSFTGSATACFRPPFQSNASSAIEPGRKRVQTRYRRRNVVDGISP